MKISNRDLWKAGALYGDPTLIGARDPGQKRKHTAREKNEVQNPILKMLRLHYQVAWCARINSGAYKTKDGRFIRFGFVGCADIIGQMKDGGFLALECKSEDGEATDDQKAFIAKVKQNGGCAAIVRSVDEAMEVIRGYVES